MRGARFIVGLGVAITVTTWRVVSAASGGLFLLFLGSKEEVRLAVGISALL